jgi:predicted RNA-binding Zn-ribbon protein involved in translation (DUF1610 family)
MYIKEFEYINVIFKTQMQASRWTNKLNYLIEKDKLINLHWSLLKNSTFRTMHIKVKCDDCGDIINRRIKDLKVNKNYHLCNKCINKGSRNGQFGVEKTQLQIDSVKKFIKEKGNPFSWDIVKNKLKIKQTETTKKVVSKNIGKKRTNETKKKISNGIKLAYKLGKIKRGNGYSNIKILKYKDIPYQGTYELNFLKFVEKQNKLNLIERGPIISYFINNEEHSYLIDYKIKNTNIVFEIKSTYYWKKSEYINIIKKETAEKLYNYYLIMDNNFNNIKQLFI